MGIEKVTNTEGKIFYGLHFYPGVAEYREKDKVERVFINEQTIRSMDANFAGKPIFVEHVDGVTDSIDELRKEADGWVVESFYNSADGKHWVKFIIVSEKAERAVKSGMRLSNAYIPELADTPGTWNGVSYSKQIVGGVYEHLAIVNSPRYEESVIMTPEQFKKYNSDHEVELKRIANSKETKGEPKMGLSFFKKAKVDNSIDIESTSVILPESKKEMTISELVKNQDKIENMHGYASNEHMVKVGNDEMSVKDLVKKHMAACNEIEDMKKKNEEPDSDDMQKENSEESLEEDEKDVGDRGGDKNLNKEDEAKDEEKKKNAIAKAAALKNAGPKFENSYAPRIDLMTDKLARGKELF